MYKFKKILLLFILPIFSLILSSCEEYNMVGININLKEKTNDYLDVKDKISLEIGFGFQEESNIIASPIEDYYNSTKERLTSIEGETVDYADIEEIFFTIYASNPKITIENKTFKEIINKELPIIDDYKEISGYQYIKDIKEPQCFFKDYIYKSTGSKFNQTTFNHYEFIDIPISCFENTNCFSLALAYYAVTENGCYLISYKETFMRCSYNIDSEVTTISVYI